MLDPNKPMRLKNGYLPGLNELMDAIRIYGPDINTLFYETWFENIPEDSDPLKWTKEMIEELERKTKEQNFTNMLMEAEAYRKL